MFAEVETHTPRSERLLELRARLVEVAALHERVLDAAATERALRERAGASVEAPRTGDGELDRLAADMVAIET